MNHSFGYRKLGRRSDHRRAMLRNMATSFLENGKIDTTIARAKELRPLVEKLITLGKKGHLHARRQVASYVFTPKATTNVFDDYGLRFKERNGGYTRIVRFGQRVGDAASMCRLELVDYVPNLAFKEKTEVPAEG